MPPNVRFLVRNIYDIALSREREGSIIIQILNNGNIISSHKVSVNLGEEQAKPSAPQQNVVLAAVRENKMVCTV